MSATMQQETMTVSTSTIVDLIAALQAAADVLWNLDEDERLTPEILSDAIGSKADDFRAALFGPVPEEDDAYETDPLLVELKARSLEFEADTLTWCWNARVRHEEILNSGDERNGRVAQLREYSKRVRSAGTMDVRFPTSQELRDRARVEKARAEANGAC